MNMIDFRNSKRIVKLEPRNDKTKVKTFTALPTINIGHERATRNLDEIHIS